MEGHIIQYKWRRRKGDTQASARKWRKKGRGARVIRETNKSGKKGWMLYVSGADRSKKYRRKR